MSKIINIILFVIAWLLCVFLSGAGAAIALFLLCVYLFTKIDRPHELKIVIYAGLVGVLIDQGLALLDVFRYYGDTHLIALWSIAIWFWFAATLNSALQFLQKIPLIFSAILGAIVEPFLYLLVERLNPHLIYYPKGLKETAVILFVVWFFLLPILITIARKISKKATSADIN
jgi:hypothetical protein